MITRGLFSKIALTFALFSAASIQGRAEDSVKLGFLPCKTGPFEPESAYEIKSAELAVKQINAKGGINGRKIELVTIDSKSTPQGAAEATKELIQKGVTAIVGPIWSTQVVTMLPAIKAAKMPLMIGAQSPQLTYDGNGWVFRLRPDSAVVASGMLKFVHDDLKKQKIGIIHDTTQFGKSGSAELHKQAGDFKLKIVKRIEFGKADTDLSRQIAEMKAAGADALIGYAITDNAENLLSAWKAAGRPFPLLGSSGFGAQVVLAHMADTAEGSYASADTVFSETEAGRKFAAAFQAEYHEDPDTLHSYTFDAVQLLARALSSGKDLSGDSLRMAIRNVKDYQSVYGPVDFDNTGNGLHEVSIVKTDKHKFKLVKVVRTEK